jgi:hypothetical protein
MTGSSGATRAVSRALAGLRQPQVDLDGCAVRVVIATAETGDGRLIDDDPKSQAGRRRVAFPKEIAPEMHWHLGRFAQPGDDGLVFIGPKGGQAAAVYLPADLDQGPRRRKPARPAFSRFVPHGQHDGGGPVRMPAGADGANGTLQRPGRTHLPARHPGARRGHRGGHGQAATPGAAQGQDCGRGSGHGVIIGHVAGTRPGTRLLEIT